MFLVYKLRVDVKLRAVPGLNPTLFLVLLVVYRYPAKIGDNFKRIAHEPL